MCVVNPVIRPPTTRAHLEWVPGRQAMPSGPIAAQRAGKLGFLAAHHLRHAGGVLADRPGTSFTSAQSNGTSNSARASSAAPAGHGR